MSEAGAAKREKDSYAKGASEAKAFFQEKGLLPGSKAPATDNGNGALNYGSMTLDQIDKMPTADWLAIPEERRKQLLTAARTRR